MSSSAITDQPQQPNAEGQNAESIPVVLSRSNHRISRKDIDADALKVLYRLKRAGHLAYLVGGSVRDLLLGRKPKDFDIGTDASPNQVKKLFRNSRIIGRRFRIAHLLFRGKVIEVATFRSDRPDTGIERDGSGRIRIDNCYGSPAEDARRRDLTINGLFYDIGTFGVIDYVGGLRDLEQGIIRMIGDPETRIHEDPVRVMRAVRQSARTGFPVEPVTWDAIVRFNHLIATCPAARVAEEFLKDLRGGSLKPSLQLYQKSGLLSVLLPELAKFLDCSDSTERPSEADPRATPAALMCNAGLIDRLQSSRQNQQPNVILLGLLMVPMARHLVQQQLSGESQKMGGVWDSVARSGIKTLLRGIGIGKRDSEQVALMLIAQWRFDAAQRHPRALRPISGRAYFQLAARLHELEKRAARTSRRRRKPRRRSKTLKSET